MKYDYGKIGRLAESLSKNGIDPAIVEKIMKGGESIKQTDKNEKKAEWFYGAMTTMDSSLSPEIRKKVREDCACCLGGKRHLICKDINKKYPNKGDRLKAANDAKLVFGNGVREISPGKYQVSFFPDEWETKPCPCVKGLDKAMPITYCQCCGGHVKFHLETVLGKKLSVTVKETALTTLGKKSCRFELSEE